MVDPTPVNSVALIASVDSPVKMADDADRGL